MTNPALLDIYASGHATSSPPVPDGCAQIFAPCLDIHCERPCGARPYTERAAAINNDMAAEKRRAGFLEFFGLFLAFGIAVSLVAGVTVKGAENWKATQLAEMEP